MRYPITANTRHEIIVPKTNYVNYLVYFVLQGICPMCIIVGCVDAHGAYALKDKNNINLLQPR
jgi:hypothetical protein